MLLMMIMMTVFTDDDDDDDHSVTRMTMLKLMAAIASRCECEFLSSDVTDSAATASPARQFAGFPI